MCGIVGVFNYGNNKPIERNILQKMCDAIKHRGPDDEGFYPISNIGLGIRRLAIIDLETGHQPIHNEDKTLWIVLNGEIYNFLDLRKELEEKHTFYTKTDAEVILHLYEEYGEKCVLYLRGMFAFAVWDEKKQKLFIAKDRLGKKPLYYTTQNGTFIFASEIKSILEYLNKIPEIDCESIDLFLTYQYIPSPRTIFKNIRSLLPAHTLFCDGSGIIKIQKYWELSFKEKINLSFSDAALRIKDILTEATRLRMLSDVPLGAFLSGGHDSSIIVGLMSHLSHKPVKTFSIGFEEEEFSELKYARIVAKHFSCEHNEFIIRPNYVEILPKLVWHYGQPFADPSALPSYFVARETRKYVKVALNGDGGDENFCGYLRYKAIKLSSVLPFQVLGKSFYKKLGSLLPATGKLRYFNRFISVLGYPPSMRNLLWHSYFTAEQKDFIYTDFMRSQIKNDAYNYLVGTFENAPACNLIDRVSFTDIMTYLPECLLVKMDIASMANSLESRSPFLDHKLIEFTASLPPEWKIRGFETKYILKYAFKDLLPREILGRKKQGFGIPVDRWFRQEWQGYFREVVLSQKALSRGYFQTDAIEQLFEEHIRGKKDNGYRLWALLVLELWHRVYIDRDIKIDTAL